MFFWFAWLVGEFVIRLQICIRFISFWSFFEAFFLVFWSFFRCFIVFHETPLNFYWRYFWIDKQFSFVNRGDVRLKFAYQFLGLYNPSLIVFVNPNQENFNTLHLLLIFITKLLLPFFLTANTGLYAHYVFNTLDKDHTGILSFEVSKLTHVSIIFIDQVK